MKNTDLSRANHAFNAIAHEINLEFPNLDIIWIPHLPGQRKKALQSALPRIEDHPAGTHIIPYLEGLAKLDDPEYRMSGIGIEKSNNILGKNKAIACVFVNSETLEEAHSIKETAYIDLFQVLELLKSPDFNLKKLKKKHGNTIQPLTSIREQILLNLGGDYFAAICQALEGQKNTILKIAKRRATQTMEAKAHHKPELYTFPIMLDLAKLLYKNQRNNLENRKNLEKTLFKSAFPIAKDIQTGLDFTAAKSWADFCANTQILAWSGIEPKKILGSAVYTCEDPYMRSDAYLTSEILNIEPALMTDFDFYNPFADEELNERRHKKHCIEMFEAMVLRTSTEDTEECLQQIITTQNQLFLEGKILGWAAPAFIKLKQDCSQSKEPEKIIENAEETFKERINEIPWPVIKLAGEVLIKAKRKGGEIDKNTASQLLAPKEGMRELIKFLT